MENVVTRKPKYEGPVSLESDFFTCALYYDVALEEREEIQARVSKEVMC